jgi:UDP-GlcNAc:undecaprenyl-phosphate/decaprenyl-phosphate GlcNAc-1-phosphate transferase
LLLSFVVPLILVLVTMPPYLRYLTRKNMVVDDIHKRPQTKVPSPAGPILFVGAMAGELVALAFFGTMVPVALIGMAIVAFTVGIVDDLYVLGGLTKPLSLLLAGTPLVLAVALKSDLYDPHLTFPLLGTTGEHLILYTFLAVIAFPVVANAFNMMDSFNGELSWFALLTSAALLFGVVLHVLYTPGFSLAHVAATLPLVAVAAAFLVYNRFPSKAFDGDSGSLLLGALFAGLAIVDGVEVAAIIAIVPAILNSFYTLSSVRGFVERRHMGARPTYIGEDGRLHASPERSAPNTLVRLILLGGPMGEKELVRDVTILTAVACLLSGVISALTWAI